MIRPGRYTDILPLLKLTSKLFYESGYSDSLGVSYSEDSCMYFLKWQMDGDDRTILVYEKDGEIVGFLIGQKGRWMLNKDEFIGVSLYWYVDPKHRKGLASTSLIKAFEEWCRKVGCVGIDTGTTTALQGRRVSKLFERLGFPEYGITHSKSLRRNGDG